MNPGLKDPVFMASVAPGSWAGRPHASWWRKARNPGEFEGARAGFWLDPPVTASPSMSCGAAAKER